MQKNENRSGYKKTKVGWIPLDWKSPAIGAVLKLSRYGCNAPTTKDGNILVVGMKNLQNGEIQLTDLVCVALSNEEQQQFMLKRDDVLINRTNSYDLVGKVGIFDSDEEVAFVSYLVLLRGNQEYIRQKYLNFWLNSYPSQKSIKRIATKGVSQANINPTEFKKHCYIPLPPLPEQEAIAGVLECWDKAIRNYEKKIERKRNIKKGLMQQFLSGKQRLPGFSGEWKEIQLRDVLAQKPKYGINAAAVPYAEDLPTYLRITDISEYGRFLSDGAVSVNNIRFEEYYLNSGDLVFARTGASTGKTYLYNPNDGRLVFAGFLIKVTPDPSRLLPQFLKFYTETDAYWKWVSVMCMRSGQPGINGNEYAKLDLRLPSVPEQQAIASLLSAADSEIEAMERKLVILKDQKKFLLNNLVTGTIRLPKFRGRTKNTDTNGDHT